MGILFYKHHSNHIKIQNSTRFQLCQSNFILLGTSKLQINFQKMAVEVTTVKPNFMDISLTRTPRYYGQFSLSLGKIHTFSLNSTRLIRTSVNADNGHLFLAQSTNSHRKSTLLMPTLHYQLCVVINLSFFQVKNLSVDRMSMFPALKYTGYDDLQTSIFRLLLASNELCREWFWIN